MIFDGKRFACEIEDRLWEKGLVKGKSLVIFSCNDRGEESQYVRLKRRAGEKLGVRVAVKIVKDKQELVKRLSDVDAWDGVLVQLPIAGADREETEQILNLIPVEKDVDGLNSASDFLPAAVMAVEKILDQIYQTHPGGGFGIGVVGARGMVGSRLVKRLTELEYKVGEVDVEDDLSELKQYDVVISAVGKAGLIKQDMVRDGVVAIDLGYPEGDFEDRIKQTARLLTPVPGGVGPVTVICLFENLAKV